MSGLEIEQPKAFRLPENVDNSSKKQPFEGNES
jgi:hypothetical protein